MAIKALLRLAQEEEQGGVFSPDDIVAITAAFESTLRALRLTNRTDDPAVTNVAKLTIEVANQGERDPERLSEAVLRVGFKISDSKYRSIDAETGRYRRPCALGKRSPLRLSNPVLDNDVLRNDTCNQLK